MLCCNAVVKPRGSDVPWYFQPLKFREAKANFCCNVP